MPSQRQNQILKAVKNGDFSKVNLCPKDFQPLKLGIMIAQTAAKNGHLDKITSFLNQEIVSGQTNRGETVAHLAAKYGHLNQIPKGYLLDKSLIELKNTRRLTFQNYEEHFPTHRIRSILDAIHFEKRLSNILQASDLLFSIDGWTVAHQAIKYDLFYKIPPEWLTLDAVSMFSKKMSVYFYAVKRGVANHIPEAVRQKVPPWVQ